MQIYQKIMSGFLTIVLLFITITFGTLFISQRIFERILGQQTALFAQKLMDNIDAEIYQRFEQLNVFTLTLENNQVLLDSNQEFADIENLDEHIYEIDKQWTASFGKDSLPILKEMLDNQLSQKMREEFEVKRYYVEKYGNAIFQEMFVTNEHGANVAITNRIIDYNQSDEMWWTKARKEGHYIGDLYYDERTKRQVLDMAIRINDSYGNFLGVINVVLDVKEIFATLQTFFSSGKNASTSRDPLRDPFHYLVLDSQGKILYSTKETFRGFKYSEFVSEDILSEIFNGKETAGYFIFEGEASSSQKKLMSYAYSRGYKDSKGKGWVLLVEHDKKELLDEVIQLRNFLLFISLIISILAVIVSVLLSNSFSSSVFKLKKFAAQIGRKHLNKRIAVKRKDAFGELAIVMNDMAEKLEAYFEEFKKKLQEKDNDLTHKTAELNEQKQLFKEAQEALLNALDDLEEAKKNFNEEKETKDEKTKDG